jgi:hypothetical protein
MFNRSFFLRVALTRQAATVSRTTFDAAHKAAAVTITGAGLTASVSDESAGSPAWYGFYGTQSRSTGKLYFEVKLTTTATRASVAFADTYDTDYPSLQSFDAGEMAGIRCNGTGKWSAGVNMTSFASFDETFADGDIVNVPIDFNAGKIWFGINNVYNVSASQNPATGVNPEFTFTPPLTLFPYFVLHSGGPGVASMTLRTVTSAFTYSPPSGFTGWDN